MDENDFRWDFEIMIPGTEHCKAWETKVPDENRARQILKSLDLLTSDLSRRTSAAVMAENFGVSETSLKNYFRAVYGQPYGECLNELRMDKAAKLLEDGTMKVAEIAAAVGYSSQSRFAKAFREIYGIPPLEYRRRAKLQQGINGETEEK